MLKVTANPHGYDVKLGKHWLASVTKSQNGWELWGAFPDAGTFETVGAAANAAIELTFEYA
jgi:hypothetical protein